MTPNQADIERAARLIGHARSCTAWFGGSDPTKVLQGPCDCSAMERAELVLEYHYAALAKRGAQVVEWRPIHEAPKLRNSPHNGTPILVFGGQYRRPTEVQADGGWWNREIAAGRGRNLPTHFMPLPAPPKEKP